MTKNEPSQANPGGFASSPEGGAAGGDRSEQTERVSLGVLHKNSLGGTGFLLTSVEMFRNINSSME